MRNNKDDNYYKILTIPNLITTFRIIASIGLCSFIAVCGITNPLLITLATIGIGATDAIDGYLSRKCGMASQLGGILDPIADKVYNWGIGITLMATGIMPLWPLLIAVRDASVFAISSYQFKKNGLEMKPTMPAKLKMFFQSVGVISTLAFGFGSKGLSLIAPLSMACAIGTIGPEIYCIKKKFFDKQTISSKEVIESNNVNIEEKQDEDKEKSLTHEYQDSINYNYNHDFDHNIHTQERNKVKKKSIYQKFD